MRPTLSFASAFLVSFLIGSLVEYWVHRGMHRGVLLAERHRRHHASNEAKGVLPEWLDYLQGGVFLLPWGFFVSVPFGAGWVVGGVAYGFFSALGHQLQHENPAACFWMRRMPVHFVHHKFDQRDGNFGLALPIWDRVFGTYVPMDWSADELPGRDRSWWRIHWLRNPASPTGPVSWTGTRSSSSR